MTIIFLICVIIYLFHNEITSARSLHMLQQNRYNRGYRYIKWIIRNFKENFINLNLLFLVFIALQYTENLKTISPYIFIIVYLFLTFKFIVERKNEYNKLPLKYTSRIKRIMVTSSILYLLPVFFIGISFDEEYMSNYFLVLGLISYLNLFVILLANFLNRPVEKLVGEFFKQKALTKLNSMTNMDVIGITGSYGKTSTKNVVNDILNIKYNVYKTPANYNTPFGLMITINQFLDKYNDYYPRKPLSKHFCIYERYRLRRPRGLQSFPQMITLYHFISIIPHLVL